jgi:hypothetical protein
VTHRWVAGKMVDKWMTLVGWLMGMRMNRWMDIDEVIQP